MSPGWITVQGMTAAIRVFGPASPSTARPILDSSLALPAGEAAVSSVWGSSGITRSGRTARPSAVEWIRPRTRAVTPIALTTAPDAAEPRTVGRTTCPSVQPTRVRSPPRVCPPPRWTTPSRRRTG
jgi:hypothetical protein